MTSRGLALVAGLALAGAAAPDARALPRGMSVERFEPGETDVFDHDLFVAAQQVRADGVYRNDLFVFAAGALDLPGRYDNDVWAFGEIVRFTGRAADHVRLAGRTVNFSGEADNTVSAIGYAVRVAPEAALRNGLWILAEEAILSGRIHGGARVRAQRITVSGRIEGDLDLAGHDLVLLSGTRIEGDLIYTAAEELVLDRGVFISGRTLRRPPPAAAPTLAQRAATASGLFAGALLAGLPFVFFLPRAAGGAARRLREGFWACLLTGAAAAVLVPLLALLGAMILVGLPLAAVLLSAGVVALYLGHLVTALRIGSALLGRRGEQPFGRVFPVLAVGLLVQYAWVPVPALALAVGFVSAAAGAGALILTAAGRAVPGEAGPARPETE